MRRSVLIFFAVTLFAPAGAARAQDRAQAPAQVAAHAMAFQFVLERQIVFPIVIDGKPAEAWLDSGASATVVDAAFARQIGLELGAPIKAHGVAGEVADGRLAKAGLIAGDLAMPDRRVVVVDIEFQGGRITLTPRDGFVPPPGAPLPLTPSGDLRSVPIKVGGVEMAAILDLGNAGGLLIDAAFAEHYGLLEGRRASTTLGVGADGAREEGQTTLHLLEVGG